MNSSNAINKSNEPAHEFKYLVSNVNNKSNEPASSFDLLFVLLFA